LKKNKNTHKPQTQTRRNQKKFNVLAELSASAANIRYSPAASSSFHTHTDNSKQKKVTSEKPKRIIKSNKQQEERLIDQQSTEKKTETSTSESGGSFLGMRFVPLPSEVSAIHI
jgi:hypothetical protein